MRYIAFTCSNLVTIIFDLSVVIFSEEKGSYTSKAFN
jgi:hypothetical protein